MMNERYDNLKLENLPCFALYVCAKEIVKKFTPFLNELDLTYTQYIAMIVLWEHKEVNVKELGQYLFLDSGTLTPLLKKLEQKGYILRNKNSQDERVLNVSLTPAGAALEEKAALIPPQMSGCINLNDQEKKDLSKILHKVLTSV